jgi:hypothetical protein
MANAPLRAVATRSASTVDEMPMKEAVRIGVAIAPAIEVVRSFLQGVEWIVPPLLSRPSDGGVNSRGRDGCDAPTLEARSI